MRAVREHKRVIVKSGNTIGKSFIAADTAMDWLTIHKPARVITLAPTYSQVVGIIWKEIRNYYFKSKIPLGGKMNQDELILGDDWFAEGISTDRVDRLQGRHNPNLLVIIDEGSGVMPEIWETVDALHPRCILAIGNPLDASGNFYDAFNSPLWHKLTISCEECVSWQEKHGVINGLVTEEWIKDQEQIHGRSSPWFQVHVMGEFPIEGPDSLISRDWVNTCRKSFKDRGLDEDDEDNCERLQACDVATKHGENMTVIGFRFGHTIKTMRGHFRTKITETANLLAFGALEHKADITVIDSDGVGEGLSDILEERHVPRLEFHGGYGYKAVDERKFKNLRTQFYILLAKKLEKGMYDLSRIPESEFEILKNQLCAIKVKAPDGLGRLQIETKEDMLTRGVKSPDHADCLMMSEYGYWMSRYQEVQPHAWR